MHKKCACCRKKKPLNEFPRKVDAKGVEISRGRTCTLCCIDLRRPAKHDWRIDDPTGLIATATLAAFEDYLAATRHRKTQLEYNRRYNIEKRGRPDRRKENPTDDTPTL